MAEELLSISVSVADELDSISDAEDDVSGASVVEGTDSVSVSVAEDDVSGTSVEEGIDSVSVSVSVAEVADEVSGTSVGEELVTAGEVNDSVSVAMLEELECVSVADV